MKNNKKKIAATQRKAAKRANSSPYLSQTEYSLLAGLARPYAQSVQRKDVESLFRHVKRIFQNLPEELQSELPKIEINARKHTITATNQQFDTEGKLTEYYNIEAGPLPEKIMLDNCVTRPISRLAQRVLADYDTFA